MDAVTDGLLGGLLTRPAGRFLNKFTYLIVFLGCSALGFTACVVIAVVEAHSLGDWTSFVDGSWWPAVALSTFVGRGGVFLKYTVRPPSWEEAKEALRMSGYNRFVSDDGSTVTFSKGDITFIADVSANHPPRNIECWKEGGKMGEIQLRLDGADFSRYRR